MDASIAGGCFCGAVRYESDAAPFNPTICHCASCRRLVGGVAIAWVFVPKAAFRFVTGTPTRFASSPNVARTFCGRCGTSLTYESTNFAGELDITIASLDSPGAVPPADHTHVAEALPWETLTDGLPAYPGSRPKA